MVNGFPAASADAWKSRCFDNEWLKDRIQEVGLVDWTLALCIIHGRAG